MSDNQQHPLQGVMQTTMQNIKDMVDVNTVIGSPIKLDNGTTVIPVSKVAFGFASGGSDFGGKNGDKQNFGGGGGAGVTITPVSFLIIGLDGKASIIQADQQATVVDKAIDAVPGIIDKVKDAIKKD